MKITVKNDWVLSFNGLRGNLNMVNKETLKPTYQLGRDAMYAITRTGRLIRGDIDLLIEQEQALQGTKAELEKCEDVTKKAELEKEVKEMQTERDAIMEKKIEVEVHQFKLTDLPPDVAMPEAFWDVLEPLIVNGEVKK